MTAWGSRLPFSLDPLIAEAKRRMRRRRLFAVVVVLLLAGGAAGTAFAFKSSGSPGGAALTSPLAGARLSPLSNLATRMAPCGNRYSSCHSPDGKWSIVYVNRSAGPVSYNYASGKVSGYEVPRVGCTLMVTRLATGQREQIHLEVPGCDNALWLGDRYVFQDPVLGSSGRVLSVDLPSRRVAVLAHFGSDVVSPNGRWIAGETELPHGGPWLVAVVSLTSHICRVVAQGGALTAGLAMYGQNIAIDRSPWESASNPLKSLGYRDPVVWRTVVQGGERVRVVTGPGTGFTRDSRSVIVATWQHAVRRRLPIVVHRRLVKFNLASLRTPCPASVTARG